jgi:MoaA/NifB/PqqE/SkfB family radical SAM enzyme
MLTQLIKLTNVIWYLRVKKIKTELASLQLDVTSQCNLRCKTCYFFKNGSHLADDMSIKEIEILFKEYRDRPVYQLWLYGGEPSLREEIIALAYHYFPVLTIITNGQIKISPIYKRARLHVSLDGLEKENDYLRGQGTFQKIINNYQEDKRVIFNVTISKMNLPTLEELIDYVKSLKTAGIEFQIFSRSDKSTKFDKQLALDDKDLQVVKNILRSYHYDLKVFVTKPLINSWLKRDLSGGCILSHDNYIHCYASDKNRKSCCTPGVICKECKILAVHLIETVERDNDLMTKLKFALWM